VRGNGCTSLVRNEPSPPTILKKVITACNVKELCDLEVLDLSKRSAKSPREALVGV
jgi:hypothetical protein